MQKLNKLTLFLFVLFFITNSLGFSQSAGDDVYRKIDGAFRSKDIILIEEILLLNKGTKEYESIESYVLNSAREAYVAEDLDFASKATLALIDANLDNFAAVELYTDIEKAIEKQKIAQREAEEKRQIEAFKRQAAESKTKDTIKKEYRTITNTTSGETVFLDPDYNMRFNQVSWGGYLGLADVAFVIDGDEFSPKYGLSIAGNGIFRHDNYSVGGEIFADILLMSFSGFQNLLSSVKISSMFASNKLQRNMYFRLGFSSLITTVDKKPNASTVIPEVYLGPTLGMGFRDIKIANFLCDGYIDYNFAHLFYDNTYTTIELGVNFLLILADLNKVNVGFNFGANNILTVTNNGIHNQTKLVVSIGVGKND